MPKKRFKLLLIRPKQYLKHYSVQSEMARLMGRRTANSVLALPLLAALTPEHYEIKILDEEISTSTGNFKPDIVGITLITSNAERGYELAEKYRKIGAKIILGGPYSSYNPGEGLQYADSIVSGEAEAVWKEVLNDFENNNLQKIYSAENKIDYSTSILPRWDLVKTNKILSINVQASRGCPFQCEFCLTSEFFGKKMRKRNVSDVINEIKQLPLKNIFFADDNLTLDKKYAGELFKELKPLNISWMCQSSVDVADDKEFLKEMSEAGCKFILIGFESLNSKSLEETNKYQNDKEMYLDIIERIHQAGIHVYGSFIIGFDNDTPEDLETFKHFVSKACIPVFMLSIMVTTHGTQLHERLERENRHLKNLGKNYFIGSYPVFKYANFSSKEIYEQYNETIEELYSFARVRKRTINLLKKGYFSKSKSDGSITAFQKFRTTFTILFSFAMSREKEKQLFFRDIISLIKSKKLAINEAASVLIMLEGISRHIKKEKKQRHLFYKELERIENTN